MTGRGAGPVLVAARRRRAAVTADQVRAWFDTWARQRLAGTELDANSVPNTQPITLSVLRNFTRTAGVYC